MLLRGCIPKADRQWAYLSRYGKKWVEFRTVRHEPVVRLIERARGSSQPSFRELRQSIPLIDQRGLNGVEAAGVYSINLKRLIFNVAKYSSD